MKVIFDTPYFEVVQADGKHGLLIKNTSVAILPYTINDSGIVDQIGVLKEWNPLREGNYASTLITGTIDNSDEDAYATAVRELMEEGGIDMRGDSPDKWTYLGNFYDSKDTDRCTPTFAVDITGKTPDAPGTVGEEKSKFLIKDANEVITLSRETLLLAAFLRLFNVMYQKSFKNAK